MENINSVALLKEAIVNLEIKKIEQGKIIRAQFDTIKENLKPANIFRNTLAEVKNSPRVRSKLFGALLGIVAGYYSKKMVTGKKSTPFRRILGNLLQVGITAVMAKKPDLFQTLGQTIVKRVFTNKHPYEPNRYY